MRVAFWDETIFYCLEVTLPPLNRRRGAQKGWQCSLENWNRPIWTWLQIYSTSKRFQLKRNRLDYQSLFREGAHSNRLDFRGQQKSSLRMEIKAFLLPMTIVSLITP